MRICVWLERARVTKPFSLWTLHTLHFCCCVFCFILVCLPQKNLQVQRLHNPHVLYVCSRSDITNTAVSLFCNELFRNSIALFCDLDQNVVTLTPKVTFAGWMRLKAHDHQQGTVGETRSLLTLRSRTHTTAGLYHCWDTMERSANFGVKSGSLSNNSVQ